VETAPHRLTSASVSDDKVDHRQTDNEEDERNPNAAALDQLDVDLLLDVEQLAAEIDHPENVTEQPPDLLIIEDSVEADHVPHDDTIEADQGAHQASVEGAAKNAAPVLTEQEFSTATKPSPMAHTDDPMQKHSRSNKGSATYKPIGRHAGTHKSAKGKGSGKVLDKHSIGDSKKALSLQSTTRSASTPSYIVTGVSPLPIQSRWSAAYGGPPQGPVRRGKRSPRPKKSGPLIVKPPFQAPVLDKTGRPNNPVSPPSRKEAWDEQHHKIGTENELLPKQMRSYFSRPQSLPELRGELTVRRDGLAKSLVSILDADEVPPTKPPRISADAGAPVCPERHTFGGTMNDRDGSMRPWNDRWQTGIHLINENLHPLHRMAFTQKSLFEASPSQRWRRFLDYEVAHGEWKPIQTKRSNRFPPLGV